MVKPGQKVVVIGAYHCKDRALSSGIVVGVSPVRKKGKTKTKVTLRFNDGKRAILDYHDVYDHQEYWRIFYDE